MRTTEITGNLIQLTYGGFVNAYLVREDDGFTLVDTMLSGRAGELIAAARLAGGDVKRIVLTHGHGDHVGSLDALKDALGVDVYMPELDAHPAASLRGQAARLVAEAGDRPGRPAERRRPDRLARDRRSRPHAGPRLVPGLRDRALIAGDAFATLGG